MHASIHRTTLLISFFFVPIFLLVNRNFVLSQSPSDHSPSSRSTSTAARFFFFPRLFVEAPFLRFAAFTSARSSLSRRFRACSSRSRRCRPNVSASAVVELSSSLVRFFPSILAFALAIARMVFPKKLRFGRGLTGDAAGVLAVATVAGPPPFPTSVAAAVAPPAHAARGATALVDAPDASRATCANMRARARAYPSPTRRVERVERVRLCRRRHSTGEWKSIQKKSGVARDASLERRGMNEEDDTNRHTIRYILRWIAWRLNRMAHAIKACASLPLEA